VLVIEIEPVRAVNMTDAQFQDFQDQMFYLSNEISSLYTIPRGVEDHDGQGGVVKHGPWVAEDCALVLTRWIEAGLIEFRSDGIPLSEAEAAARLTDPHWTDEPDDSDPWIEVVASDHSRQYPAWMSLIPRELFGSTGG
jgi:hypothetical protein